MWLHIFMKKKQVSFMKKKKRKRVSEPHEMQHEEYDFWWKREL